MITQSDVVDAVLSVEGDEGFAMLGDWAHIGPAEFEPIHSGAKPGTDAWNRDARAASELALRKLQARFPDRIIRGEWQSPQ
jgi:hypothetical protein